MAKSQKRYTVGTQCECRPYEYYSCDNFFTEKELSQIWEEIYRAFENGWFVIDEKSASKTLDGKPRSYRYAYWPNEIPTWSGKNSAIMKHVTKIFGEHQKKFSECCFAAKSIDACGRYNCVVNYYHDHGVYAPHMDDAICTAVYFLETQYSDFSGGEFVLTELDETIEFKNNKMVLFPSQAFHGVKPVRLNSEEAPWGAGRFAITQFIS